MRKASIHTALLALVLVVWESTCFAQASSATEFKSALEMVHGFSGAGDELDRVKAVADRLERSAPRSGYAQTLRAEIISTFQLDQQGRPPHLHAEVLRLSAEAQRLNPTLADAHVPLARALILASDYAGASKELDAAFDLDPANVGATFLQARLLHRQARASEAESWYRRFIAAAPTDRRRSNGYSWLGDLFAQMGTIEPSNQSEWHRKARDAYEKMLELDPSAAWKNANFAYFLNRWDMAPDAAERHARIALDQMDFRMARIQWAAARYRRLESSLPAVQGAELRQAAQQIADETRVSLDDTIGFLGFDSPAVRRLERLMLRLQLAGR